MQGGGGPAEPVLSKQSVLTDDVKSNAKGGVPAPVRASETGRARNWTMPPLQLERECKEHSAEQNDLLSFCERRNSATIDNRCVEFDRRESTESTAIIGLRALGRRIAFTMAEILLSLTIIGVVAAITLPSLTGNINERTWNTQRKALYARFSQAIALMPALNGYGVLKEESSAGASDAEDTAAETFVTNGLSKVMKINNICDNEHVQDCGLNSTFTDMLGSIKSLPLTMTDLNASMTQTSYSDTTGTGSFSMLNTKAAAFETQNGESILLFYNPNCVAAMGETSNYFMQPKVCVNMVYDLNGNKGPNTTGKDIGIMTIFYPTDSIVVAPTPYRTKFLNVTDTDASRVCTQDAGSDYRIPNLSELGSMFVNNSILGLDIGRGDYSSEKIVLNGSIHYWVMGSYGQYRIPRTGAQWSVTCVKR